MLNKVKQVMKLLKKEPHIPFILLDTHIAYRVDAISRSLTPVVSREQALEEFISAFLPSAKVEIERFRINGG